MPLTPAQVDELVRRERSVAGLIGDLDIIARGQVPPGVTPAQVIDISVPNERRVLRDFDAELERESILFGALPLTESIFGTQLSRARKRLGELDDALLAALERAKRGLAIKSGGELLFDPLVPDPTDKPDMAAIHILIGTVVIVLAIVFVAR